MAFDWKQNLKDASFRGVKFSVVDSDYGTGRKTVVHQYPSLSDSSEGSGSNVSTYVEDLGQGIDEYVIDAFIVQQPPFFNYFDERDALITALKKRGSGRLIHPFLGTKRVSVVGQPRIKESFKEGGIARFSITFVETTDPRFPKAATALSGIQAFLDKTNQMIDAFADTFDSALSVVDDIESALQSVRTAVRGVTGFAGTLIASVESIITELEATVATAIQSPCAAGKALTEAYEGLGALMGQSGNIIPNTSDLCSGRKPDGTKEKINTEAPAADGTLTPEQGQSIIQQCTTTMQDYDKDTIQLDVTSPTNAQKAANQVAVSTLAKGAGLMIACRAAIFIDYESSDQAKATLDKVVASIDALMEDVGALTNNSEYGKYGINIAGDETYTALQEARSILITIMSDLGTDLANVLSFDVPAGVHNTLVLAYNQYEDLDRAAAVRQRNKELIFHPGFIPEGGTIKLLSK